MNNTNVYTHAPIIEQCRNGNSKAQFTLYSNYSKAMYNLAYRMLNNHEDAEDILQETFVDCFRNLESFRFESTFGAWLKRILVNKCINQIKKRKAELVLYEDLPDKIDDEENEPVYNTEKILKGIEMLPDGYRIVLTLFLLEGYSHSEISQIMNITESTSKSQYLRAKTKLKKILLTL